MSSALNRMSKAGAVLVPVDVSLELVHETMYTARTVRDYEAPRALAAYLFSHRAASGELQPKPADDEVGLGEAMPEDGEESVHHEGVSGKGPHRSARVLDAVVSVSAVAAALDKHAAACSLRQSPSDAAWSWPPLPQALTSQLSAQTAVPHVAYLRALLQARTRSTQVLCDVMRSKGLAAIAYPTTACVANSVQRMSNDPSAPEVLGLGLSNGDHVLSAGGADSDDVKLRADASVKIGAADGAAAGDEVAKKTCSGIPAITSQETAGKADAPRTGKAGGAAGVAPAASAGEGMDAFMVLALSRASCLAAVAGMPAISLPVGATQPRPGALPGTPAAERLPVGLTLLGLPGQDARLLCTAQSVQALQALLPNPLCMRVWGKGVS